jgi:hypothetical protein
MSLVLDISECPGPKSRPSLALKGWDLFCSDSPGQAARLEEEKLVALGASSGLLSQVGRGRECVCMCVCIGSLEQGLEGCAGVHQPASWGGVTAILGR